MFKNHLFKNYSATVCGITMQAYVATVDSKVVTSRPPDHNWDLKRCSKFNIKMYRKHFYEIKCYKELLFR